MKQIEAIIAGIIIFGAVVNVMSYYEVKDLKQRITEIEQKEPIQVEEVYVEKRFIDL